MNSISVSAQVVLLFFFQAEDGIRDLVRSRGLGDVYKRQRTASIESHAASGTATRPPPIATTMLSVSS